MVNLAPPFLRQAAGEALVRAYGDVKDFLLDRTKQAVKARFAAIAPRDAVTAIGGERQLPQGPTELPADYAARVVGAWDAWPLAGTAKGILNALRDGGYVGVQLFIAKGWRFTLDPTTQALVKVNLMPGIVTPYWASFFVYFPAASFPARWSGTPPAQSSDEGQFIIGQVKKWKSAIARFDKVAFDQGGPLWGTVSWGAFNWGGAAPIIWDGPF